MTAEALMLAGALAGLVMAKLVLVAVDYAPALVRRRVVGAKQPALVRAS